MWAGFAHLTLGNLVIGMLEAGIVRWRFAKRAGGRLITSIVAGNYISCIAGYLSNSASKSSGLIFGAGSRQPSWLAMARWSFSIISELRRVQLSLLCHQRSISGAWHDNSS